VRVGLIGSILIGIILFLIIKAAIKISNESLLHAQISIFSLSAFFLFSIANVTDMHLRPVGWYFLAIVGGIVYSFSLWTPTGAVGGPLPLVAVETQASAHRIKSLPLRGE
jgi:hypothetical protein